MPGEVNIGGNCKFGKGGLGIVIHNNAVIGNGCVIGNNVTIGGASRKTQGKLPILGDNVRVGAGCVIIGDVTIGNNVIIGANSVVTMNIISIQ